MFLSRWPACTHSSRVTMLSWSRSSFLKNNLASRSRSCSFWMSTTSRDRARRKFPGNFPEISRKFPGHFPEISRKFPGSFPEISREISRKFPGNVPEISRNFPDFFRKSPGNFPEISRTFPGNVREIPGNVPEISRKFPGNVGVPKTLVGLTRIFWGLSEV